MAADKALIAGAAKVAGAQAKVDYSTTKAFTDLGEDVMKGAESILATMKENQEAYDEEYDSDVGEIRTNALTLDEDVNVSMFGTDETVKKMDDASTAATDELNKVGATNFDFYDASKKGKIFELRKEAQKMSSITNSELDKLNESKKMINDGFQKSQFVEQGNENYMIFDAYLKGNAKWGSGEETKKADRFGYEIEMNGTKRFVTRREMDEARKYYFQKDNSAEVVDFVNNSTKRRFKTATNNAQANIIFKQEKEALLSNMDNLEKLVISQSPNDLQTIKNQFTKNGKFNKENYEDFLKRQGDQYLQEQQALHYEGTTANDIPVLSPNKLYDIEQDKLAGEKFNAYLDTVTLGRGGLRSGFQKPTLEGWVNSKAGIKSLSEGGFSLAKIEYEEGPPDISLVNDANGRKSKLEPEMLKTSDMDYIKNVMRALKKLN